MVETKELLKAVVEGLVDKPELVELSAHEDDNMAVFTVACDESDVGKLLGKRGVYAESIRRLFGALYGKQCKQFTFYVNDRRRQQPRA